MKANPKKMLIIGPSWVGDTVMAQSLFKLIKQAEPTTEIDVLAPAWTFSLLSRMPEVSHTIELPITHGQLKWRLRYHIAQQLKQAGYDQAIVLPNSFKSALIPWLAGIPKRTGWLGECRFGLLNDIRYFNKKRYPLMVEQYLALGLPLKSALPLDYPYPRLHVATDTLNATLMKHQPLRQGRPVLALCPGAEFGPSKRWPVEYYATVANKKINEGWDVWLFGSNNDRTVTDSIMTLTQNRCDNLAGRLQLSETIDLLSLVSGVVTNDSGLMHIAAALNKPLIALYGSTSPVHTPPLSPLAQIATVNLACQPCFKRECPLKHHHCMRQLTPDSVFPLMSGWQPVCVS